MSKRKTKPLVIKRTPKEWEETWARVRVDWEAGIKTVSLIAIEHNVARISMIRYFEKAGIQRNLTGSIVERAHTIVAEDVINKDVINKDAGASRKHRPHNIAAIITELNAEMLANVIRSQYRDLGKLRSLAAVLLDQVAAVVDDKPLFKKLGKLLASKENADLTELYNKVVGLPASIDGVKKLAETMKIVIELERKVFRLDFLADEDKSEGDDKESDARVISAFGRTALASLTKEINGE